MRKRMDLIIQQKPVALYKKESTKNNTNTNINTNKYTNTIDQNNTTFSLYLEPFLNTYYQTYQNVITLNTMPDGPLSKMVMRMNTARLSSYQSTTMNNCKYILLRYPFESLSIRSGVCKNADAFMGIDDIPSILGYLISNGYTVDTSLTKMLFQSRIDVDNSSDRGERKLICISTFKNVPVDMLCEETI